MDLPFRFWCYLTISTYLVTFLNALPASYCLYPINKTDCGGQPTPVFSYYKSGSRCEIEIWRGCPSYNRFDNEATCSHYCIGRLQFDNDDNSDENKIVDYDADPCEGKLNTNNCGRPPTTVYTFNAEKKSCIKSEWRGCKTKNMFSSQGKCNKMCQRFGDIDKWAKKIENLTPHQLEQLNIMLDEYLTQNGQDNGEGEPESPIHEATNIAADEQTADAQPTDAQPADAQPADAKPADAQTDDAQPADGGGDAPAANEGEEAPAASEKPPPPDVEAPEGGEGRRSKA